MNTIISGSENQKDLSQRLVVRKYKFVISIDIKFIVLGMLLDCTSQRWLVLPSDDDVHINFQLKVREIVT